jgi:hypothetical protein
MPTFKVEMRLHTTVTLRVEAASENEVYAVLDERGDELDPESYWKADTSVDWNQGNPVSVEPIPGNPTADYVIAETRFGKDFVVRQLSESLPGVEMETKMEMKK